MKRKHVTRLGMLAVAISLVLALAYSAAGQDSKPADSPDQPTAAKTEQARETAKAAPERTHELEEIVITATRTPRQVLETPRSVSIVDRERLDRVQPLVAIDSLKYEPGIWLEHRTTSTADPIIRGFAGYNILTLVDGNTLSTLWGEGGEGADDMYGKIDPDWVERIEVIRGPASVLYGSNAVGGVINLVTREPALDYTDHGMNLRFRTKATYGSAANEARLRSEIHGATPDFRFMLGGSYRDIEDVEGGRGLGTLVPSDSEAANWDFTSEFRPLGEEHTFKVTYQDTHLSHTKRYYRSDEDNFNDRDALALSYVNTAANSIWDQLEARVYYQYKQDRRRWLSGPDAGQRGVAKTTTYSSDLQITRNLGDDHRLSYGLHWELDDGESPGDEQFTLSGPGYTQKVKGTPDSVWQDYGVFVQDEWDALDRLTVIASARYDAFYFRSDVDQYYVPPLAGQDPSIDEISEKEGEFSGGLGLNYYLDETVNLFGNYSRGFRLNAPNFGIWLVHGNAYRIPNAFLDPIIADQFELGAKGTGEGYEATVAGYYTVIDNQQREVPTTYNGSDFYDRDGDGIQEPENEEFPYVEVASGGKATLKGVEFTTQAQLDTVGEWFGIRDAVGPGWSVRGGFAWEIGKDRETDQPLEFTHPAVGVAAVRYELTEVEHPAWVELVGTFVRRYDRIFDEGGRAWLDDPQDPSSGYYRDYVGVPGYSLFDLRGGVELSKSTSLTLAVENLTDKRYRAAHSRMDAPGINFLASIDVWF
ncbi:MAG: TonB-dependent receptor [Planctomycetota bacterium]